MLLPNEVQQSTFDKRIPDYDKSCVITINKALLCYVEKIAKK